MAKRCGRCGTTNLKFVRTEGSEDIYACRHGAKCGRETRFEHSEGVADAGSQPPKQAATVPAAPSEQSIPAESLHLYKCRLCFDYTLTIQIDEGEVQPTIDCRARGFFECPGAAERIPMAMWPKDAPTEPGWEWVRLDDPDRMASDENAAVAFAVRHMPLTLKARIATA